MNKHLLPFTLLAAVLVIAVSCKRDKDQQHMPLVAEAPVLPQDALNYNEAAINEMIFPSEPVNNHKATLGRVLFYDKILSVNNTVSCASCHQQNKAFSDVRDFSFGFTGKPTARNAMPIFNLQQTSSLFWDVREDDLQTMVLRPVENHIEMGFDNPSHIMEKIKHTPYYASLFAKAYGTNNTEEMYEYMVRESLAEFVRSMVSGSSKYDEGVKNNFSNFTAQEKLGKQLFTEKLQCNGCHIGETFSPTSGWSNPVANIGLDKVYKDKGANGDRMGVPDAEGFFKIPSLRNVAVTGPYMHDGRFKNLEEVVEHYNSGVNDHKYLDWHFKEAKMVEENGQMVQKIVVRRMNLNNQEKAALVAFMQTLTDTRLTTADRFSNPFRPVK